MGSRLGTEERGGSWATGRAGTCGLVRSDLAGPRKVLVSIPVTNEQTKGCLSCCVSKKHQQAQTATICHKVMFVFVVEIGYVLIEIIYGECCGLEVDTPSNTAVCEDYPIKNSDTA